jgi:hypothetical protein
MMRTWQARLRLDEDTSGRLSAYAELYGKVERSLFAALAGGRAKNELKREYIQRFGITARHFNAIRIGLEGKVRSIQERQPDLIKEVTQRIGKAGTTIAKLRDIRGGTAEQRSKRANKPWVSMFLSVLGCTGNTTCLYCTASSMMLRMADKPS